MDTETSVRVEYEGEDEIVVYRLMPDTARELAQVMLGAGRRTNDGGWLQDAEKLQRAADEAEDPAR